MARLEGQQSMNREEAVDVLKGLVGTDTLDDAAVEQVFVDDTGVPVKSVSKDKMLEYAYSYALHREKAAAREKAEAQRQQTLSR